MKHLHEWLNDLLQDPFGGGEFASQSRVEGDRLAQGSAEGLEDGLQAVVVFVSREQIHVEGHATGVGQGLEKFMEESMADTASQGLGERASPSQVGTAREVDDHAGQCLVQWHGGRAETSDPALVAQGVLECLAKRESDILHGVMWVDFQVAVCPNRQCEMTMAAHRVQHVIKERQSRLESILGRSLVQIQLDGDLGLLGITLDGGLAGHLEQLKV